MVLGADKQMFAVRCNFHRINFFNILRQQDKFHVAIIQVANTNMVTYWAQLIQF